MKLRRGIAALLASLMLLSLTACGAGGKSTGTDTMPDTLPVSEPAETEPVTTEAPTPVVELPDHVNPLTGLACEKDLTQTRPVAIMLNNLWAALPQMGIAGCDILYECLVEGGITRLMGVVADCETLGVIGSIRSSRHYYLDLAQNYDALYVHAGGSTYAYEEIKARGIHNMDGVNMYIPNMFYRDQERLKTMSYEHTLMTTGENIAAGIAYKKYRTELREDLRGKDAFTFVTYGEERVPDGESALCVYLPYSRYQQIRLDYDARTGTYLRYQFEDVPHIDGITGDQLAFTNVLILFCPTKAIAGDTYGRLDITTEGSGTGYYLYGGRYEPITWEKPTEDAATTYYGADGEALVLNRGKTFISIFPDYNAEEIDFAFTPTTTTE